MKNPSYEVYELYEKITPWFDQHRNKDLMEQSYLDIILDNIPSNGKILDLGCGTGEPIAKFFIEKSIHITGVDAAQAMIKVCQQRFPQMSWLLEDMRTLDLSKKFDAVIAWDSFFHLTHDEQRAMFRMFEKHVKPSGLLMFTSGPSYSEEYSIMNGHEFYHASLGPDEYKDLLERHNFKVILYRAEDPMCGNHTVWIAQANPIT